MPCEITFALGQDQALRILDFERTLADFFLGKVEITNHPSSLAEDPNFLNLVINIECNFSFLETFTKFLNFPRASEGLKTQIDFSDFGLTFKRLRQSFNSSADIHEIAINFDDTSIIVTKAYNGAIVDEFEDVVQALVDHLQCYTNIIPTLPYEIHVPVIDESTYGLISQIPKNVVISHKSSPYLKYWALYFDALPHAVIYDLKKMGIVPGKLIMVSD